MDKKKPNYVINITGGAGKNLMFSGVAKNIKKSFPNHNLIVLTPYPQLLINNPSIDRVYQTGSTPYLYEDLVSNNSKNIVSSIEPYGDGQYILEKEHLIQTWSRLLGAESDMQIPEIFINSRELNAFVNINREKFQNYKYPILVINPFGGPTQDMKYNWNRDLPVDIAQTLVNFYREKGYLVVQVSRKDQIQLDNVVPFEGNFRDICCLLKISQKRILIDSFCQHASAALGLPSTVCWITNKPKVFGYEMHDNILAKKGSLETSHIDSVFRNDNWDGSWLYSYPYEDNESIFDISEIIDSVDSEPK